MLIDIVKDLDSVSRDCVMHSYKWRHGSESFLRSESMNSPHFVESEGS
jgi:hypothetical protein